MSIFLFIIENNDSKDYRAIDDLTSLKKSNLYMSIIEYILWRS